MPLILFNCLDVDLGVPSENHLDYGITELTALVRVLPMLIERTSVTSIIVKSPQLCQLAESNCDSNFWTHVADNESRRTPSQREAISKRNSLPTFKSIAC